MSDEQRQMMFDEFRNRKGSFVDRASGKTINYADATDLQAEEKIADEFADFRLGKLPAKSLGERILRFFRAILNFFKSFVQKPSLKEQLFKDINTGKFRERTLAKEALTGAPEYRAAEGLTEKQTADTVMDMTARASIYLFGNAKRLLYSPLGVTGKEVFDNIEQKYIKENRRQQLTENAWKELVKKTKEQLYTLGVRIDASDRASINEADQTRLGYAPEPFATDWKKNSPFPIKFTLSTLIKMKADNVEGALSVQSLTPNLSKSVLGYQLVNFEIGRAHV